VVSELIAALVEVMAQADLRRHVASAHYEFSWCAAMCVSRGPG